MTKKEDLAALLGKNTTHVLAVLAGNRPDLGEYSLGVSGTDDQPFLLFCVESEDISMLPTSITIEDEEVSVQVQGNWEAPLDMIRRRDQYFPGGVSPNSANRAVQNIADKII